jgi:dsDNA-binding SOS-regulon protein
MVKRARHKFGAVRTERDGMSFSSKLEAAYYDRLKLLQMAGEVSFFLRQVPFHLPGGVKYVVDYQVFYADGDVEFVDVKGMETPEFVAKKKMVEALYPVEILVQKKLR